MDTPNIFYMLFLFFIASIFGLIIYDCVVPAEEIEIEKINEHIRYFKPIKTTGYIQEYERDINDAAYIMDGMVFNSKKVYVYDIPCIYKLTNNSDIWIYLFSYCEMDVNKKVEIDGYRVVVHNTDDIFFEITKYTYIN